MKADIHPEWYPQTQITCNCGNTITVGSTKASIRVDVCSRCHPFFTGEMKFVDTKGRVEKFQSKVAKAASLPKTKKTARGKTVEEDRQPKTLKEMLMELNK